MVFRRFFHATLDHRIKAVRLLRHQHKIAVLCKVLKVNRSTYYKRYNGKTAPRTLENQKLRQLILNHYLNADKRFGPAKIQRILFREDGISISIGRIYRLMKQMSLPKMATTTKPKYKRTPPEYYVLSQNKLKQAFNPPAPNQVWASDFTYIPIGSKKSVYLSVVLDLFSRKVIAWHVSANIDTNLALKTLNSAYMSRQLSESLLLHTDQGSQFTASKYQQYLDQHNLIHSWSKPGYPWDNVVTESFFKYIKNVLIEENFHHLNPLDWPALNILKVFTIPKDPIAL